MDENALESAIQTARRAAEKARDFKPETYGSVLLFELMRSTVPTSRSSYELPPPKPAHVPGRTKPYSAAELFSSTNWRTEIDKVVVAGFYLEQFDGIQSYTIQEIRNCLVAAKIILPKNVNLAILQAAQKGWIMEVPGQSGTRKAWALTQTGERRAREMSQEQGAMRTD
jgi:hypothetical protein